MNYHDVELIDRLVAEVLKNPLNSHVDIEKLCWMVVHEHHHGVMPFEYDIRAIDENLYLAVLKIVKQRLEI